MDRDEIERLAVVVSTEFQGIAPQCKAFYFHSIHYSAGRCLDSFDRYEKLAIADASPDLLICVIQEAVGHAAALSRYFWPSLMANKSQPNIRGLTEKRGDKLRELFGLADISPLYNRDLRNAWEHFDERLDLYLLKNDAGCFFPASILGSHSLADDPIGHIFKLLDLDAECLVLMGKKYFFAPIRDEVRRIHSKTIK